MVYGTQSGPLGAFCLIGETGNRTHHRVMRAGVARSGAGEVSGREDKLGKRTGGRLSDQSPEEGRGRAVVEVGGVKVKPQGTLMGIIDKFQAESGCCWGGRSRGRRQ